MDTQLIGRMIMPALRIDKIGIDAAREEAYRHLDEVGPCGFIIFGGEADAVAHLTADLRMRAGRKLLFAADLERGAGQQFKGLTVLPTPAAIAACEGAEALACLAGKKTASEALSIGVNLIFAPMCDVNTEPSNPIINVRTFSSEPAVVGRLAKAWIHGAQATGAVACAKHFPGHGGTKTDSHLELPIGPKDESEMRLHLAPFQDAFSCGVGSVMVAHMTVPSIDSSGLPATLSRRVISGLLREEMGYDGLVITDALIMDGLHEDEVYASVLAAEAGCDILLYPNSPKAVLERLIAANFDPAKTLERISRILDDSLADRIARRAITLVEGTVVKPAKFVVIHDDHRLDPTPFVQACHAAGMEEGTDAPTVAAVYSMPGAWRGRSGPSEESLLRIPKGAGVVSFGDPYFLDKVSAPYKIAAYDDHPLSQKAVVDLLNGKMTAKGSLTLK